MIPKQIVIAAGFQIRRGILAAIALSAWSSQSLATSEWLLDVEQYVKAASPHRATLSHVVVHELPDPAQASMARRGIRPRVSASLEVESGATARAVLAAQEVSPDEHYLPIDAELEFSRPGVFTGTLRIEVATEGQTIAEEREFYLQHTETDTFLISYLEYRNQKLLDAQRQLTPSDPYANLEPDDIPGEARSFVDTCVPRVNQRGFSCSE